MAKLSAKAWRRIQPSSLRQALELCKDFARETLNKSVDRIADEMGLTDKHLIYKWLQSGRIPANLVRPYETACGVDFVTRWIAVSAGKILIDMPSGRKLAGTDVAALHSGFGSAVQSLNDFYGKKADAAATLAALTAHLEDVAWHRANIEHHAEPELDFSA